MQAARFDPISSSPGVLASVLFEAKLDTDRSLLIAQRIHKTASEILIDWADAWQCTPMLALAEPQVLSGEVAIQDLACREAVFQELSRSAAGHCGPRAAPRQSLPSGLIAAGGHDVTWHSLRCISHVSRLSKFILA